MEVEKMKEIIEIEEYKKVNDYLKNGWILFSHYTREYEYNDERNQWVVYCLGWTKETEPIHPSRSPLSPEELKAFRESEARADAALEERRLKSPFAGGQK